jgi:predicted transport protein
MSTEPPKVALLDADFLVYRIGFSTEEASEQIAKSRLTEWLTDIVYINLGCEDYKAWITGKTNYRNDVAVTQPYKGNRKDFVKPKHYDALREHLMRLGAVVTEGEEADDAVAIESSCGYYWIVHQDKDLNQLPGHHYNPVTDERYFVSDTEALRNFYTQLLTGDRTDHIKGLHLIGPKKAEKILKDCKTEAEMYAAVKKAYESKEEPFERLVENGKLLWLRREPGQMWEPPSETK